MGESDQVVCAIE